MKLEKLNDFGRTITVQFQCRRCKATATKPLSDSIPVDGFLDPIRLYDLVPPNDWRNGGFYYPLLCPECAMKYDRFMSGEDVDGQ